MKIITFRSSKGDCLLISATANNTNHHLLFDGGMTSSFKDHVAPYLNTEIQKNNENIDLLCVTHIDEDHIKGVLTYMDLLADWRVHHYKTSQNEPTQKPGTPEPPNITAIWHNSFAETYELGSTIPRIEQALHEIETLTFQYKDDTTNPELEELHDIATSIKQGITLSQLLRPEQLNIPLNPHSNGNVIKCNQSTPAKNIFDIGPMKVVVLGPFSRDLTELKAEWEAWEQEHASELTEYYSDLNATALNAPLSTAALKQLLTNSGAMGDRGDVTIPNLASIILYIEMQGKTIVMTGDAHADDILKGLKKNSLMNQGKIHVDVLKVQHHGAVANIHEEFCTTVIADHYIFCGNGTHNNPELDVVELIARHRPDTNSNYMLWFNTHPADDLTSGQQEHMEALEQKLKDLKAQDASGHFGYTFIGQNSSFFEIDL